jgi:type I restriction enzyme S subunit
MLVDGENSGEVFIVPQDGYMGSTFKQLWISSSMHEPYVLAFIQFYKETLRNSKKGAAIPHLNKELFYGLPPLQEQRRIVLKIEQSSQLLR